MHSFNALAGGDVYGVEFGTGYFYEQAWPQQAFDYRLEYIMNHVNSKLGKPWKQLNDYIFAFEAENEAMIGKVGSIAAVCRGHADISCALQGQAYIEAHQQW